MTLVKGGIQWAERQLKDLPTVALGKVSLLGLDWGTFLLVVAMCIWKDTTDSNTTLWAWLGFLAGMHGILIRQFLKSRRLTHDGAVWCHTAPCDRRRA